MTLDEFMESGRYLPPFLRDFHDQKRIFKIVQEVVTRRVEHDRKRGPIPHPLDGSNWVNHHIYVIDFFLWVMARHGYTLQKTRARVPSLDLEETIADFRKRDMERSVSILTRE